MTSRIWWAAFQPTNSWFFRYT